MWTCKKCGEVLEDSFDSCWKCGTECDGTPATPEFEEKKEEWEDSDTTEDIESDSSQQKPKRTRSGAQPNQPIAQIGQKISTSLFTGHGFSKTSIVLTKDRLTGVGQTYAARGRAIVSFTGDLRSVSSLGLEYNSNYILLILGLATLVIFGLGIIFLIMYVMSKERYIVVNFQGMGYALSLQGISNKEVENFIETAQNQIQIAKNGYLPAQA